MFASSLVRRSLVPSSQRSFASLVLAEHFEGKLNPNVGAVLTAAAKLEDPTVDVLVHGENCDAQIEAL
jgi:hypothetical protein